jgi:peptide/nickel transport system ATP-binding protein
MTSLNPVKRIAKQIIEGMRAHGKFSRRAARERALGLLRRMGVPSPERALQGYPHQLSGGMRQRVMLTIGFGNQPSLIIADEPTTALDVTIQREILQLLKELNTELGTAILLVTHDLGVVAALCHRVAVMYAGEIVESGTVGAVLSRPLHPYTQSLLNAVPRLDRPSPAMRRLHVIEGQPPDPRNHLSGCRFAERCPYRIEACTEHPTLHELAPGHRAACWVAERSGSQVPWHEPPGVIQVADAAVEKRRLSDEPILTLRDLTKHFPLANSKPFGRVRVVHAVDDVDLSVARGETLGLVGESGSGKSTVARLITRLSDPTAGVIRFKGADITRMGPAEIRPLRRHMQMIFQDPYASLNPRMTVGEIIAEPYRFHEPEASAAAVATQVQDILARVGLGGAGMAARYPHEFSGGQRQRIGIARSLILRPEFIVADEPVSALDVNIQAQVINLLAELQEELGLTYVIIAHDLAVIRHMSDRIAVMYMGRIVEVATAHSIFATPLHPYTRLLIDSVPIPDPVIERERRRIFPTREMPSVIEPPSGCRFRTRCPLARPICAEVRPLLEGNAAGHAVACHFPGELEKIAH